jgi:hypothetical protein
MVVIQYVPLEMHHYCNITYIKYLLDSFLRGLLYRSIARYFQKGSKTILHKTRANSRKNIIYKRYVYKYFLKLL